MADGSERQVGLHPLVIINISDHYTRNKVASSGDSEEQLRTVGALFGVQTGLSIQIYNSYEFKIDIIEGEVIIDNRHLMGKIDQFAKVFEGYELLGWYSTGSEVRESDMQLHKKVSEFNENPLFLLMSPDVDPGAKELPITVYESQLHVLDNLPTMIFVNVGFKVDTVEPERVAVDHVTKAHPGGGDAAGSRLRLQLGTMHNAVEKLTQRVRALQHFLRASRDGTIERDHALLREAHSVCNQLPVIDAGTFDPEFYRTYNDTLLVTYLSSITKGTHALDQVIEKFNLVNRGSRSKRDRRGGGLDSGGDLWQRDF